MKREFKFYLEDILQSIDKIERYINEDSIDEFKKKEILIDAIMNNLLIIGEAVSQIPLEEKEKYSFVEWREIVGFRNIAIHKYHSINLNMVWNIIKDKIPKLKKDISLILKNLK